MPLWSMDNWEYVERQVVTDPKGRAWTVALMDVLGQEGDPDMPDQMLQLEYAAGRYFTLVYSTSGAIQYERGYPSLTDARDKYVELLADVISGTLDPSQPVFRADLEGD